MTAHVAQEWLVNASQALAARATLWANLDDNEWHALTALAVLMGELQPALVAELLDRKEWIRDPKAIAAVQKKFNRLTDKGAWDLDTVREEPEILAEARAKGDKIHIGDVMSIFSRRFVEMGPDMDVEFLEVKPLCMSVDDFHT